MQNSIKARSIEILYKNEFWICELFNYKNRTAHRDITDWKNVNADRVVLTDIIKN